MTDRPPRPFVSWIDMESRCGCIWRNCRHRRRVAAENAQRRLLGQQYDALTDDDLRWLDEMGWRW